MFGPVSSGPGVREHRTIVQGDRVSCRLAGPVKLDRCRECVYLVRLERSVGSRPALVICADLTSEVDVEFAW
jgi:hypothetical protein